MKTTKTYSKSVAEEMKASAKSAKAIKLHTLIKDLPSETYHGLSGSWSSSQLKDIIDNEELFIKKYIKKEIDRTEIAAFSTGTYFHTRVLEPEKMSKEIAVWTGKAKIGKAFEVFKSKHKNKCIVTEKQKEEGERLSEAVLESKIAKDFLNGAPEISLFIKLTVIDGDIYCKHFKKILTKEGWRDFTGKIGDGFDMVIKVRADMLGKVYVSDLKSTSGDVKSGESVRGSISKYKYDLSAALYLDLFSLVRPVREFIWIFASKGAFNCATWKASPKNILIGRAKYMKAIRAIVKCAEANWEVEDYLREAEPLQHELEWLTERETDLL